MKPQLFENNHRPDNATTMPNQEEDASPSRTAHDTIGFSPLATPTSINMPRKRPTSSLFSPARGKSAIPVRVGASPRSDTRLPKTNYSSINHSRGPSEISTSTSNSPRFDRTFDDRLDDYTLDFDKLSNLQSDVDDDRDTGFLSDLKSSREDKTLSDVGGPDDFTANMDKYLFGEVGPIGKNSAVDKDEKNGKVTANNTQEHSSSKPSQDQPAAGDEAELGEYSEFGPPIDMSTPSHLLRRDGVLAKDEERLEEIEEDPTDSLGKAASSSFKMQNSPFDNAKVDETDDDLRRQIADLQQALKDRDEQLDLSRQQASSSAEQIRQLRVDLRNKSTLLEELRSRNSEEILLREQIQFLQKQCDEKESILQKSTLGVSEVNYLREQIADVQKHIQQMQKQLETQHGDMQKQLQSQRTLSNSNAESSEVVASLRQQLSSTQDQLKKRDDILEETVAKLKEVTATKEQQLQEKNSDIDDLKAQIEDQLLDIERLETDIEQANTDYRDLEKRILTLENKHRPLEEKNMSLEAEMAAQQNALKAVAADLPIQTGGNTYAEILDLIKDLWQSDPSHTTQLHPTETELRQSRQDLVQLKVELEEANSTKSAADAELARFKEQASETQALIDTVGRENSRLTTRVDELNSSLEKLQLEYAEAMDRLKHLQEEKRSTQQQPSPPPSPPQQGTQIAVVLEESHRAQLGSLQNAHATTISELRASHADVTRRLQDRLIAAEKRGSVLETQLDALRFSATAQEAQLQALNEEIKRLESVIAVKNEAAAAVDQRIAWSVEKREKEWQRRVDLLLRDRDRMGKALMVSWAEKESGETKMNKLGEGKDADGLYYRYKYTQKHGMKKA